MSTNTKPCPMCAEEIPAETAFCPFCRTEFDVITHGYCSNCHSLVQADAAGKCLKCGTEVLDRQVESRTKVRAAAAPAPGAPPLHVPPAPGAPARVIEVFERKGEDPGVRFIASWFDQIILGVIFVPIVLLASFLFLGGIDDLIDPGSLPVFFFLILALLLFASWVLYFSVQEGIFGTTLGKVVGAWPLRLKVIRKEGGKVGFGKAFLRAVIGFFETNLIGAIVIWSTGLRQRLGDLAAGTLVVDATKIRRAEFGPSSVIIEFLDGTRKEMVQITKAVITKWLGVPQWMNVRGLDPQGRKVKFGARITKGVTVFGTESKVGQLRRALEAAFHFPFKEMTEWWRIALIVGILLLGALCIGGVSLLPSLPDPTLWFAPEAKTVSIDGLHIYPTGTRVTVDGYLYLPARVSCDTNCGVCLSREAYGSCDLPIFITVDDKSPASPNTMDPLPSVYHSSDFWVTADNGRRMENHTRVRITGRVCETTAGDMCINHITEILYRP